MASESKGTVLVALGVNMVIAVAKLFGGLLTGSSAMLSEAAHSVADTLNEVFLLVSLRRGNKPADVLHPFGYGKERFFWALLAAVGIFVAGASFSLYEGLHGLFTGGEQSPEYLINYIVLAVAFVAEGSSLAKALRQVRGEAREADRGIVEHIRRSPDPTVKTVASEDSAAVAGLLLAFAGLGLHQLTGSAVWDSLAAICIGVLLAFVAFALGRDTKALLIGEAADPRLQLEIYRLLGGYPEVDTVVELLTMNVGPTSVLVAARLDLAEDLPSSSVENVSTRIEQELHERFPEVGQVFLDATRAREGDARRTAEQVAALERELGG